MSCGTGLSNLLTEKEITKKQAAEEIGISINTLSNILNDKVFPSGETKNKILIYINKLGYTESDLLNSSYLFKNLRIRSSSTLSGIEKSNTRDSMICEFKIIKKSDLRINDWIDIADIYDFPDGKGNTITFYERRKTLKKELKNNQKNLPELISKLYKKFRYNKLYFGCYCPVVIKEFLLQLGIRVFSIYIETEKISGFSTSLFPENTTDEQIELEPFIVINRKVCNTTEKCFFEMAKQLFFMLTNEGYNFKSFNTIEIENKEYEKEAIQFAENILLPLNYLNSYLERFNISFKNTNISNAEKDKLLNYFEFDYLIDCIKRDFYSSYELVIKQLLKSNSPYSKIFNDYEEARNYYFECLKRHDEKYSEKTTFLNGEPNPLPLSFFGHDASELFIDKKD